MKKVVDKDKTDPKVLLDTGQFHLLQKILTQLKEGSPNKEPPGNGQLVVNAEKLKELEKMLNQMKDDMVRLSKVKPVTNSGNVYLYLMGIAIALGLIGFILVLVARPDLDPLIYGGLDFGFVTAIVTLLNNTMVAQKANERQQEILLHTEETLKEAKHTRELVNSGFTEWKETYLAKEYAEGQRAGLHEAEKREDKRAAKQE